MRALTLANSGSRASLQAAPAELSLSSGSAHKESHQGELTDTGFNEGVKSRREEE